MPAADSAVVLQRLAALEEKYLHAEDPALPDTSAFEDPPHTGYSGIIKNFGHLVGGSLAHGHSQIAFTNILPQAIEQDIRFRQRTGTSFVRFMLETNPEELTLFENSSFCVQVVRFMKRPLEALIMYRGDAAYLHHLQQREFIDLADVLRRVIAAVLDIMPRIGREPAYNMIFHSGPGGPLYIEMLPYTQETGGYEKLGIYVCQGSPRSTVAMFRNASVFRESPV
jgi:galactose-1-phosphate uridylyltransferase